MTYLEEEHKKKKYFNNFYGIFLEAQIVFMLFSGEHVSFPRFTLFIKNRRGNKHKVIFRIQWKRKK